MSILSPSQIHEVLKESGLKKSTDSKNPKDLQNLLEANNLGPADIIDQLSSILRTGETEGSRLKAAELGLKLNGLLQGPTESAQIVNIIIQDSEFTGINPILIPR